MLKDIIECKVIAGFPVMPKLYQLPDATKIQIKLR